MMSLRQAAELTGKSKSTLTRAIKAGRLSASRNAEGSYVIDPAELTRAYPLEERHDVQRDAQQGASRNSGTELPDAAVLRLQLDLLIEERNRERLAAERERDQLTETVADLRLRLDRAEQRTITSITEQHSRKKPLWRFWSRA